MPDHTPDSHGALRCTVQPDGSLLLDVKAVPGAKRDEVVGRLGGRLKIRITPPPEVGKANRAVCALIADALGVSPSAVTLHRGHTTAEKTLRIVGVPLEAVRARWP